MKHNTWLLVLLLTLLPALGCKQQERNVNTSSEPVAAATTGAPSPEQLGELGAKIRKEPAKADEILSQQGLTRESFEKAIREVTENPEASKRYAEAYRKASA